MPRTTDLKFRDIAVGSLVSLLWVDQTGYGWRSDLSPTGFERGGLGATRQQLWLVPRTELGASTAYEPYGPLRIDDLHRKFANLHLSKQSILKFASRYGLLQKEPTPLRKTHDSSDLVAFGEPFGEWLQEITRMRWPLELWDLVAAGDADQLSTYVEWSDDPLAVRLLTVSCRGRLHREGTRRVRRKDLPRLVANVPLPNGRHGAVSEEVIAHSLRAGDSWMFDYLKAGDPIGPVHWFVAKEVNSQLKTGTALQLFPFREDELRVVCDHLRAALYACFALEIFGPERRGPAVCCRRGECKNYFKQEHGNQRYCSEQCRKLDYYYRRKASSLSQGER